MDLLQKFKLILQNDLRQRAPKNAKAILGEKLWNKIHQETGIEGGLGHKYYEEWRVMSREEQQSAKGIALRKRPEEYYSHFNK